MTFDGVPSPMVVRLDASTLSVLSPRHPPGAVEIVVIAPTGAEARLPTAFVYEATAPTVTAVAPLSGPLDGGARVAVMGADFAPGAAVMFGGQAATEVIVSSAGIIFALTPPHPPGEVAVAVMNPGGMEGVRAKAYRYAIAQANPMGLVTDGGTGGLSTGEAGRPSVPLRGGGWSCASAGLGPSGWGFAAVWLALLGARRRSASPGSARLMG